MTDRPVTVRAPGRVNLIGGHVDHHGGLVVLMAIDRWVEARVTPIVDPVAVVSSADYEGSVRLPIDGSVDPASVEPAWGRLVGGVLRALAERGHPTAGFDAAVTSSLPIGGGLSSSAAFAVLMSIAASGPGVESIAASTLIEVAQRGEHLATGVPCGVADQTSIVAGGVILLDARDRSVEPLELPDGASVVVVDSGVARTPRALAVRDATRRGRWPQRYDSGWRSLREATAADVAEEPRARHVVSEIDRVERFADALPRRRPRDRPVGSWSPAIGRRATTTARRPPSSTCSSTS